MKIDSIIKIVKSRTKNYETLYSGLIKKNEVVILKSKFNNIVINECKSHDYGDKIYITIDNKRKNV